MPNYRNKTAQNKGNTWRTNSQQHLEEKLQPRTLLTAFLIIKSGLACQPSNQRKKKSEFVTKDKTTLQMPR